MTVLSEAHFPLFATQIEKFSDEGKFKAANGSSVKMRGLATVTLEFQMRDPVSGVLSWRSATYAGFVGQTHHNIYRQQHLQIQDGFLANGERVVKLGMKNLIKS